MALIDLELGEMNAILWRVQIIAAAAAALLVVALTPLGGWLTSADAVLRLGLVVFTGVFLILRCVSTFEESHVRRPFREARLYLLRRQEASPELGATYNWTHAGSRQTPFT